MATAPFPVILDPVAHTYRTDVGPYQAYIISYEPMDNTRIRFFQEPDGQPAPLEAVWRDRLGVLARQCTFLTSQAETTRQIFLELNKNASAAAKRRSFSVYTAYTLKPLYPGASQAANQWGRVYLGWFVIAHTPASRDTAAAGPPSARTLPHQLLYVCVDDRMQGRGIGAALVRHYERVVAAQPGGRIAWAHVLNTAATRRFYNRLHWQYMAGLTGALTPPTTLADSANATTTTTVDMFRLVEPAVDSNDGMGQ